MRAVGGYLAHVRMPARQAASLLAALADRVPNAPQLLLLLAEFAYFSLTVPHFADPFTVYQTLEGGVVVGLLALGQTVVMLSGGGGIDLSANGTLALSGMALGVLNIALGLNIWLAVAGALLTGVALGAVNGFLTCAIRIPPFIGTLATALAYSSVALQLNDARPFPDGTQPAWPHAYPSAFLTIGNGNAQDVPWLHGLPAVAGQPIPFQLLFVYAPAALVVGLTLSRTVAGRYLYAVGSNARAATLVAIRGWRVRFWCYVAAGLFAGLAAVVETAASASSRPDLGTAVNLEVILMVVVGGVSPRGGRGTVGGVVVGTLMVLFLWNGLGWYSPL